MPVPQDGQVRYPVGVRTLSLSRGSDRPLLTFLFYPADATRAAAAHVATTSDVTTRWSSSAKATTPRSQAAPATHHPVDRRTAGSGRSTADADVHVGAGHAVGAAFGNGRSGTLPGVGAAFGDPWAVRADGVTAADSEPPGQRALVKEMAAAGVRVGTAPADGRFPLVLFSHGLHGSPVRYAAAIAGWASAGFVVAAPVYPFTGLGAGHFDRDDVVNQPGDAAYVIKQVRRLDRKVGDQLAGHLDVDRVAAVGHSAGGYTTTGLFVKRHPSWLRAGVVIAGWLAPGAYGGPQASMLFIQGARDTVVPVEQGRAAYDAVPWWKSYVLLPDSWHADYMTPGAKQYRRMDSTVTDFLRWTLDGDETAHLRLPASDFPAGPAE